MWEHKKPLATVRELLRRNSMATAGREGPIGAPDHSAGLRNLPASYRDRGDSLRAPEVMQESQDWQQRIGVPCDRESRQPDSGDDCG